MKPAVPVLCVLVSVTTASAGPPAGQDTGSPRPRAAPAPRLREVRFEGDLAFEPDALKKVLKETRQPHYEARAVDADLVRLRSFYFSHAYFDARVGVGDVTVDGRDATLTLKVQSGLKYAVRRVEIDGIKREPVKQPPIRAVNSPLTLFASASSMPGASLNHTATLISLWS
jgi:hypothetical protein